MSEQGAQARGYFPAFLGSVNRDLMIYLRHRQDIFNPLIFFFIVVTLFPLGVAPDSAFLSRAAAGVIWVAALLSTLLSLDGLFADDYADGCLEQLVLSPQPLFLVVLGKIVAHWLVTGLPLLLLSPVLAIMMHLSAPGIGVLMLTLMLGTPVLSLVGAIGAALTVGLRSGGVLVPLLILPLYIPVLIFGCLSVGAAVSGMPAGGYLALMGATLALGVSLAPLAVAAALRISLSN